MKIFFPLVFVIFFTGCSTIKGFIEPFVPTQAELAEIVSEEIAHKSAEKENMDHPTLTKIIQSIDGVSEMLTLTMPPNFEGAKEMIKTKNKGTAQMALMTTIKLVEMRSKRYLKGKEQNMEEAKEIINAVLRGSKKGFKTYRQKTNPT